MIFQNYLITNPKCKTKLLILGDGRDKKRLLKFRNYQMGISSIPIQSIKTHVIFNQKFIGGIVSLNRNHKTNNIPGKLLKYLSLETSDCKYKQK